MDKNELHTYSKILSGLFALRKAFTFCDLSVMKSLYFAFIHNHAYLFWYYL